MSFTEQDNERLIAQLHRDEGSRKNPQGWHVAYLDTVGVLTIGYGHNCVTSPVPGVNKPGDIISDGRANMLFERDLDKHVQQVRFRWPWVERLDGPRQAVLYNMAFNMGIAGLATFRNTLEFIRIGDYANAAKNMLASKWAKQVKGRAARLAEQIKTGAWQ